MRIIIIGNGEIKDKSLISDNINNDDIIVCCDGGLNYAFEEGFMPKCIIGDFDSVSEQILNFFKNKSVHIREFPKEKDCTDMELCLEFSIELAKTINADEIIILGGLGSRFDHSLANINILVKAVKNGVKASLVNENNKIYIINKEIEITGKKGDLVSLLPLTEKVLNVKTSGLYYELDGKDLNFGVSLGVSNVMTGDKANVKIDDGYLIVILAKD